MSANSKDTLRLLIDKQIVGVMFDALPVNLENRKGTKTLVFSDGTGFTFNGMGAFWTETQEDISRAVRFLQNDLSRVSAELAEINRLAGITDCVHHHHYERFYACPHRQENDAAREAGKEGR